MKILQLIQGSEEWKASRLHYFTASEASIMMACSKSVKRNELLQMKALGTEQEFSSWFQEHVLDKGHAIEALARPIAEKIIGEELYPVTGLTEDEVLLASFDGLNMMGTVAWECKQYNAEKVASIQDGKMPEADRWQVVQQLIVSEAEKCLYMVTDGTEENTYTFWYELQPGDEEQLRAGWDQFATDQANYEHVEEKPVPAGADIENLPALSVNISGEVLASNLPEFEQKATAVINSIKTDLQTDQDFADAEKAVKFCKNAEDQLGRVKEQALASTASINELFKTIDRIKEATRQKRLSVDKLVKERKLAIRSDIVSSGKLALSKHIGDLEKSLEAMFGNKYPVRIPAVNDDFAGAIKGKRTITSLRSAADDLLAASKIEATQHSNLIQKNLTALNEVAESYHHLFSDASTLSLLATEHVQAEIKNRIRDEDDRLEQERETIRLQEEQRIREEQEAAAKQPTTATEEPSPAIAEQSIPVTSTPRFQTPTRRGEPLADAKCLNAAIGSWGVRNIVSASAMAELNEILTKYNVNTAALHDAA
ncbi:YqaJ viral recombinase family protein [Aliamphritea hakodatensis]|uniref:YqaJ viral recombinase family protein n=1 Tax=Aliamphritea hakodatensis TaxID=2895352 RepID=UPI0022FD492C|nr:YqaJ viral recombinase family protein [Aliamphritea hakodatensis]